MTAGMYSMLLHNLSRHVTLSDDDMSIIGTLFTEKKYRRHQYILQQGDIARYETFVASGLTRTYEIDDFGFEHVLQFGPEDWWIGDLYSFLTQTATTYQIDCLEETHVLQISRENLALLYERVPKMERHFRIMIQNAFIATTRRITSTQIKSASERYEEFLQRYPQIGQRVPNHQIASYLGVTPQSLSRIRGKKVSR